MKTTHKIGWLGSHKDLHKGIGKLVLSLGAVGYQQQPAAVYQLVLAGKQVPCGFMCGML